MYNPKRELELFLQSASLAWPWRTVPMVFLTEYGRHTSRREHGNFGALYALAWLQSPTLLRQGT